MKTVLITENTFCNGKLLLVSSKPVALDDRDALTLIQCGKAKPAPVAVFEEPAVVAPSAPVEEVYAAAEPKKPLFKKKK